MTPFVKWFVDNPVAANLLMLVIVIGGMSGYANIGKVAFPTFEMDSITVSMAYPGATPRDVEDRILIPIEEAVHHLPGVKRLRSSANEGSGSVTIDVENGFETERLLNQIKASVDAINNFPKLAERPLVRRNLMDNTVLSMAIAADLPERQLKEIGRQVRDRIAAVPGAARTELATVRDYEISIEVSEFKLREYDLTLDQVARALSRASVNLSAGRIDNGREQMQLMARGQAYSREDFENIVLRAHADGTRILVGDVARVIDGFSDNRFRVRYNGKNAIILFVKTDAAPDVVDLSQKVTRVLDRDIRPTLPAGVEIGVWSDASTMYKNRLDLLFENALSGLVLVFLLLSVFLSPALAAWVSGGILISFLGCLWMLPFTGVSLSMLSLFSFILILGIVVDDAIIVGESIYREQQQGARGHQGAVRGAATVAKPVIFSALTTMIFFAPLAFLPGTTGKVAYIIPVVVILCLLFSLIESLFILPVHLRHGGESCDSPLARFFRPVLPGIVRRFLARATAIPQGYATGLLNYLKDSLYRPFLAKILRRQYLTAACFIAVGMIIISLDLGGWIRSFAPAEAPMDSIQATIAFPAGTPYEKAEQATRDLEISARRLKAELQEKYPGRAVVRDILTWSSSSATAYLILEPSETRNLDVGKIAKRWRELTPQQPDARDIDFGYSVSNRGRQLRILLKSGDRRQIEEAAAELKKILSTYRGLYNITDSGDTARMEAVLSLRPEAANLGLALSDLARQVRQAVHGEEVQRIVRGRDDVKVMVRLPKEERSSFDAVRKMRIRAADGVAVPFATAAEVRYRRAYSYIRRTDRQRALTVRADVDGAAANAHRILSDIMKTHYADWRARYPAVAFNPGGQQQAQQEFMTGLYRGTWVALLAIYALLAIAFRSYIQPVLILLAVPFGYMGAILGHLIMGLDLGLYSFMGIVAAAGVVVNDNLVLLDHINRLKGQGHDTRTAIIRGAEERFRPIFLTSLTTFIGLLPIMTEKSVQAHFLIPTVVSLAFGVVFATIATLLLVPVLYLMMAGGGAMLSELFAKDAPSESIAE